MNNLSSKKIQKFRRQLPQNEDYLRIFDKIIDSIKFYETSEVLKMVEHSLNYFLDKIGDDKRKKYILVPNDKCGSEQWLATEFKDLLKDFEVRDEIFEEDVEEPIIVLILDDAMYSGINISGAIKSIPPSPNASIYVVTGLASSLGIKYISGIKNINIPEAYIEVMYYEKVDNVTELFSDFTKKDWNIFNDINYHIAYDKFRNMYPLIQMRGSLQEIFKGPYFNPTTVFLGHKIANEFGTLSYLITLLVDKPIDRSPIDKACKDWVLPDLYE